MRKFAEVVKEKINESEDRQERRIVEEFKLVYSTMLEHYKMTSIKNLDEQSQTSFLTEFNNYWSEENGLTEKGSRFIEKRSMTLNENSTVTQRKNFLRIKTHAVINETLRQSNLKYRLYDVLDQIYHETNAKNILGILPTETIKSVISESFNKSLNEFLNEMNTELSESVKQLPSKRKYFIKTNTK